MILLFDTNVILDIIESREPFFQSSFAAVKQTASAQYKCLFSASSVKDIFYLVKRHTKSTKTATAAIAQLSTLVDICDTSASDIQNALTLNMADFEDAVLASTALRENTDYIITRNTKDFSNSPVPVISSDDFISMLDASRNFPFNA
jgi:predicted nucleic acid-binding protein